MNNSDILGLILCNIFWSGALPASKYLFAQISPLEVGFLRNFTGLLVLLPIWWRSRSRESAPQGFSIKSGDWRIIAVGFLTFFLSAVVHMTGLRYARAIDGSILILTEPLITVIGASLILKEKMTRRMAIALLIAAVGAVILARGGGAASTADLLADAALSSVRTIGLLLFLTGMACEASYTILSKPIVKRRSPLEVFTLALAVGVVALAIVNFAHFGFRGWLARGLGYGVLDPLGIALVLYLGVLCTAFSYLYWMRLLPRANVNAMALTLYLQPVLGLIWGRVFLGEVLDPMSLMGGLLILFAVWWSGQKN